MASLTLRNIPEDLHRKLKAEAAAHGRTLREEIILRLRESLVLSRAEGLAGLAGGWEGSEELVDLVRGERRTKPRTIPPRLYRSKGGSPR